MDILGVLEGHQVADHDVEGRDPPQGVQPREPIAHSSLDPALAVARQRCMRNGEHAQVKFRAFSRHRSSGLLELD